MRLAHPRNLTLCELSLSAISILPGGKECWSYLVDNNWTPWSMIQNNEGSLLMSALYPAHSWLVWKSGLGEMERDWARDQQIHSWPIGQVREVGGSSG